MIFNIDIYFKSYQFLSYLKSYEYNVHVYSNRISYASNYNAHRYLKHDTCKLSSTFVKNYLLVMLFVQEILRFLFLIVGIFLFKTCDVCSQIYIVYTHSWIHTANHKTSYICSRITTQFSWTAQNQYDRFHRKMYITSEFESKFGYISKYKIQDFKY